MKVNSIWLTLGRRKGEKGDGMEAIKAFVTVGTHRWEDKKHVVDMNAHAEGSLGP